MRFKELYQKTVKSIGEWFNYCLVTYLVLFLGENIVPGFVSNNFDLNYLLIPVIITGIAASLGPEPERAEPRPGTVWDVLLSAGMAILGGVLIYFKIDLDFYLRLTISLLSGVLILSMSILLISPLKLNFRLPRIKIQTTLMKMVGFGLILVCTYLAGQFNLIKLPQRNNPLSPADPTLTIHVLNGSLDDDITQTFTKLLISSGYPKAFYGPADNKEYENATIIYPEGEEDQARVVESLLEPIYPIIAKQPPESTDSAEIIVILGNKINYQ
jgi:hypothetical protein